MRFPRLAQAALVTVGVVSLSMIAGRSLVFAAQAPAPPPPGQPSGPPPGGFHMPNPTNLQVLPKNLTGAQVHEIMEKWEGELGVHCNTCHVAAKDSDGHMHMNFADDSKEEKKTARVMFKMTEDINANYVSKIDSDGTAVSCGTCHRGHLGPEPFVPAKEEGHDHDHMPAPPAGAKPPGGR